ncbi:MAG: TIGR03667 family PPOX class F420-dependent oxidoreductase [Chloroflexota bacterium]|nr:TIGR03667 family PPOX class F420-dependent oxidoreductase [Chloroflexota bacterium]
MEKATLDLNEPKQAHKDERLRKEPIIWLNTVRPDGRPHSVAVWFLWDGASFLIFSEPGKQKIRNLQNNPNVTLALDDTKGGSDVVVIEGKAALHEGDAISIEMPAYVEKYSALIKQIGYDPVSMARVYSQAITVEPTKFQ